MGRGTLGRWVIGVLGCLVLTAGVSPGLAASSPPRMLVEFLELPSVWGYITEVASAAGVAAPTVSGLATAVAEHFRRIEGDWARANAGISRSLLQEGGKSIIDVAVEEMLKREDKLAHLAEILAKIRFTPPPAGELERVRITSVEAVAQTQPHP